MKANTRSRVGKSHGVIHTTHFGSIVQNKVYRFTTEFEGVITDFDAQIDYVDFIDNQFFIEMTPVKWHTEIRSEGKLKANFTDYYFEGWSIKAVTEKPT